MRRISRLKPTPAMAVAFVALFVAGAGGATATSSLVDGGDVKNNSLTSKDVRDRSLLAKDFKRGQLPRGARGPGGPRGAQGVAGPAGAAGRNGTNGFGQLVYSRGEGALIADGQTGDDVFAACPPGTFPTGGDAFYVDSAGTPIDPQPAIETQGLANIEGLPAAWIASPTPNATGAERQLIVDAICANASQLGFVSTPQTPAETGGLERPEEPELRRP